MEIKWETIPLTDELRKLDGCIVDCAYLDHHWVFVKQRHDRRHPNGKRALLGIFNSILKVLTFNID